MDFVRIKRIKSNKELTSYITEVLPDVEISQLFDTAEKEAEDVEILIMVLENILNICQKHEIPDVLRSFFEKIALLSDIQEKQKVDIASTVFIHLPRLSAKTMAKLAEYLTKKIFDTKKLFVWDLILSRILHLLWQVKGNETVEHDGMEISAVGFCSKCIQELLKFDWDKQYFVAIASMLQEIPLSKEEKLFFLHKFCHKLHKLSPNDLSVLAYHLFKLSDSGRFILGSILSISSCITAKARDEHDSDSSMLTESELRLWKSSEETILLHLANQSEFLIAEKDVSEAAKSLTFLPDTMISSFMINSLVVFSKLNRRTDLSRVSQSPILNTIKLILQNSHLEQEMFRSSFYLSRSLDSSHPICIELIFDEIIKKSEKGLDTVTNGLIGLAFFLLRAKKADEMHALAWNFLSSFIKHRHLYASSIVSSLASCLLSSPQSGAFKEALMILSIRNNRAVSQCTSTFKILIEDMPKIDPNSAVEIFSIVLPLMKSSTAIRDLFIAMLKKALLHPNPGTREMAINGACLLLKQVKYDHLSKVSSNDFNAFSCLTLTSCSMLGRTQLTQAKNVQDMLVLEVFGMLASCFQQPVGIKQTLYKGLTQTVSLNPKVVPSVIHFALPQFKKYFSVRPSEVSLNLKLLVESGDEETATLMDSVGLLTHLLAYCVVYGDKQSDEVRMLKRLVDSVVESISNRQLEDLIEGETPATSSCLISQYMNLVEALMTYCIWQINPGNEKSSRLLVLYKCYSSSSLKLDAIHNPKNKAKRKKVEPTKKHVPIWDLHTLLCFLKLLYSNSLTPADPNFAFMQADEVFQGVILSECLQQLGDLKSPHNCLQRKYSRKIFTTVVDMCEVLFQKLKAASPDDSSFILSSILDVLKLGLSTATSVFKRKTEDFDFLQKVSGSTSQDIETSCSEILKALVVTLKRFIPEDGVGYDSQVVCRMLELVDWLQGLLSSNSSYCPQLYSFILDLCSDHSIEDKNYSVVFKILFDLREKAFSGEFYSKVAASIVNEFGAINGIEHEDTMKLKALSNFTVDQTLRLLIAKINVHVDQATYLTKKASAYLSLSQHYPGKDDLDLEPMKRTERVIIVQLIDACKVLNIVANTTVTISNTLHSQVRLLTKLFTTIFRFTQHLSQRSALDASMDFAAMKFEQLLTLTRPLVKTIGHLILYIERESTRETQSVKMTAEAKARKVLKDSRGIPPLVYAMEKFSCTVISLSKRSKTDLDKLVHIGIVRDFKINSHALKSLLQERTNRAQTQGRKMRKLRRTRKTMRALKTKKTKKK